jgi:protein involved in polysaccharide export with SLBB domain
VEDLSFTNLEHLAPGDTVLVSSSLDQDINGKFTVEFDGVLKLPYHVHISALNMTLGQLKAAITAAYQPYYQTPPQIDLSLIEHKRWVELHGLVAKPNRILVSVDASLDQLIAEAGGILPQSSARFAKIELAQESRILSLEEYFNTGDHSLIPTWRGGEKITILRDHPEQMIHILGEVRNPGDVAYKPGANFLYYFTKVGGPTQFANLSQIELFQKASDPKRSYQFSVSDITDHPRLQAGDLLIFRPVGPSTFDRIIQILTTFGAVAAATAALVIIL